MNFKTTKGVKSIGLIGIVLILIAGFVLVLQPLLQQSGEFSQKIESAETDQKSVAIKLDEIKNQTRNIAEVEKLDDELSEEFPGLSNTPGLVSTISSAAVKAGISPSSITNLTAGIPTIVASTTGTDATAAAPAADAAAPAADAAAAPTPGGDASSNIAQVDVSISVEGDLAELSRFAEELNNIERNISIVSFNISQDEEGKSTAAIDAKTFIYKSIDKVPAPEGAATPAP